jgi:hypothetical protein
MVFDGFVVQFLQVEAHNQDSKVHMDFVSTFVPGAFVFPKFVIDLCSIIKLFPNDNSFGEKNREAVSKL